MHLSVIKTREIPILIALGKKSILSFCLENLNLNLWLVHSGAHKRAIYYLGCWLTHPRVNN